MHTAAELAAGAHTLDELRGALESFDGCALKSTATNLVFADGNPRARIVLIGEAPGAEEDRKGLPFVGPSGRLLDRMLASIDLDRGKVLISNIIYWRPPGNRNPATSEVAMCMPFVERLLELVDPEILIALGGPSAGALLGEKAGIGKLARTLVHLSDAPAFPPDRGAGAVSPRLSVAVAGPEKTGVARSARHQSKNRNSVEFILVF